MILEAKFSTGDSYMDLSYKAEFTRHDYFEAERYMNNINLNTKCSGFMRENGK